MLREESGVFALEKNDIGDIPDFKMIKLVDEIPVSKPYRRILRPFMGSENSYYRSPD